MRLLTLFTVILLAFGCENAEVPLDETQADVGPDSLILSVTDTIGVLMGDSLREFGSLADVEFDTDGNILALDAMKGRISIFDSSLEFAGFIGRHGAGPGEFQYPNCFAQLSDGRIVVADFSGATVTIFGSDYAFIDRLAGFPMVPPMFPAAGPEGSYYAGNMFIDMSIEGDLPTGESFIGLYSGGVEPVIVLVSYPLDISIDETGDVNVDNVDMVWDSDSRGNLYYAVSDGESYAIYGVTSEGEEILAIEKDWEPVVKTEEEMQEEFYEEGLSRSDEGESTVNRSERAHQYPYHIAIDGIYIDDEDLIWIELGYTDVPTFEVYSTAGELQKVVTIPELAGINQLVYCFQGGMLAFDFGPTDYPKIYILESVSSQQ